MNHTSIFLSPPNPTLTPRLWGYLRLPTRHSRKFLWPLMITTSAVNVLYCLAVSRTAVRNRAGPEADCTCNPIDQHPSYFTSSLAQPLNSLVAISNVYVLSSSSGLVEFPIHHVADMRLMLWKKISTGFLVGFLGCLVRFHHRNTGHTVHFITSHNPSLPYLPQRLFGTTLLFKCHLPLQMLSSDILW